MEQSDLSDEEFIETKTKFSRRKYLIFIFLLATCLKILLIPTYHSTDFEVHRNWLAITHSLPIQEWYKTNHSIWTLDYPPFFGWFEYLLSKLAVYFDSEMVRIENLDYASNNTKLFQRGSVIISDIFLVYGIYKVGNVFCGGKENFITFAVLTLCNIGLLMVDHIHFQYNGFLLGIFLISLAKVSQITKEGQLLQGAAWFAILLNLKHIYLYVAPALGIWIIKFYIFKDTKFLWRINKLLIIGFAILAMSFWPLRDQLSQVFSRLFPFKRGLMHSYWAANFWTPYAIADKLFFMLFKKLGVSFSQKVASMTGGLVQEDSFAILPTPTPVVAFLITFICMLPALRKLFICKREEKKFIRCVVICGLTSFLFGWHVHEKAILTSIIPLSILASIDSWDAKIFTLLSSSGHVAIMPLLFPPEYTPLKLMLYISYTAFAILLFKNEFKDYHLRSYEFCYLLSHLLVILYENVIHKLLFGEVLPFLPLALTSLHCSVGVIYVYVINYYRMLTE